MAVQLCPGKQKSHVPNMIPSLPRQDKGDRSYYCCTMLTLFKPWRDGLDLKSTEEDWDEVFNKHSFTDRQKQLMNNFNIKYECHDARDDFRLQRMAKEKNVSLPSWCNEQTVEHYDQEDYMEFVLSHLETDTQSDEIPDEYKLVSKQSIRKDREMSEMKSILENSGWLDFLNGWYPV